MFTSFRFALASLAIACLLMVNAKTVGAQCGRSGGGGLTGDSSTALTGLSNPRSALAVVYATSAFQPRYATTSVLTMPQQYVQSPQQMFASAQQRYFQQQQFRRQTSQRYQQQEDVLAVRQARADAIRSARAERAAARLAAKRNSKPGQTTSRRSVYVVQVSSDRETL